MKYTKHEQDLGIIVLSYEEYDKIWETCEKIQQASKTAGGNMNAIFMPRSSCPTVEQMKEHDVFRHLDKYLPLLMFYYLIDQDSEDEEYQRSRAYIKRMLDKAIVFKEDIEQDKEDGLC